ncbi:MAG: DUF1868 domain-containing protein [Cyanobacteria bacterium P01_A01_bin.84]
MDDNYQIYLNRVAKMMLPETYQNQVQHLQESQKFQLSPGGVRQAVSFPGYTLITPPAQEDTDNEKFYQKIQSYQQTLIELPFNNNLIAPLPPSSFHLTVADLIWDRAYSDACQDNPQFETDLRSCIAEIFQQYQNQSNSQNNTIRWQMLGLMIMPRAIGICLVPQNEEFYEAIMKLRRAIFQNPKLIALGIEQNYHFIAHITLGYFGKVPPNLERNKLAQALSHLNQEWLSNSPEFLVKNVQLRKFDDMTRYYRESDWASLDL